MVVARHNLIHQVYGLKIYKKGPHASRLESDYEFVFLFHLQIISLAPPTGISKAKLTNP